ncbi:TIR domain-containing protein [Gluconacetobacter azotocaptans]|uniref:TIR domain-containing protein n=1 Tax=Gluconacetobacter azotocaptans TaxID=142834 RepID=A0A7W4PI96_9PROT|nr:TIR domain-containing protein [Gluconacetobacter azotocaptans]MBB2191896.1 TIR domain-containing protein [Gluconacetobacter azotocaptans]
MSDVFNEAAVPVLTFVPPRDFGDLVGSLRTPGKHVTLSGASGCGKTTLARKALDRAGIGTGGYHWISGRDYAAEITLTNVLARALACDAAENEVVDYLVACGILVIDDFHHLGQPVRDELGAKLKRWGELGVRIFIIGISSLNKSLLDIDSELGIRNDAFEMGVQDGDFVEKVIAAGENALNFEFAPECRERFIKASLGVPSAVQMICRVACTRMELYETADKKVTIDLSMAEIKDGVLRNYKSKFQNRLIGLAKGKQQARSVHNTYFEIVRQICTIELSEIPIAELYSRIVKSVDDISERSKKSTSFYNCLNNLSDVLTQRGLDDAIYYNQKAKLISIEDPSFRLYLTLADLAEIERSVRVRRTKFPWDVAVSFAGEDRKIVEGFREELNANGYTVFYDFDEQHKLWGENLRRKLSEVYAHDAQYMIVFLSKHYPEKDWTNFELEIGRDAKAKRTSTYLLPLVVDDINIVGLSKDVGYVDLRHHSVSEAVQILIRKIEDTEVTVEQEPVAVAPANPSEQATAAIPHDVLES